MKNFTKVCALSTFWLGCLSSAVLADDTEIYQANVNPASLGARPQVLIIFDDSGSMNTSVTQQPPAYNPATVYSGSAQAGRIYWSDNGNTPSGGTNRWFYASVNRCAESVTPLATQGFYQTKAQYWGETTSQVWVPNSGGGGGWGGWGGWGGGGWGGGGGSWQTVTEGNWLDLSSSYHSDHVDCQADVVNSNPSNPGHSESGYPEEPDTDGGPYEPNGSINWGSESYTFYSANYINWFNSVGSVTRTRLEIAQEVVSNLITANTSVDFGIATFNRNVNSGSFYSTTTHDGGRIVQGIIDNMTVADRSNAVGIINGFTSDGNTPLCETTYEAYLYLTGQDVKYGLERNSSYDVPARDTSVEHTVGGDPRYIAPTNDCQYVYVILMTDGEPTQDSDANSSIRSLTGKSSCTGDGGSCLPDIAEYMANNDLDSDPTNGNQFAITYTIGFATDQELLSETASKGKGEYYTAGSAQDLANAFQSAIISILSSTSSFTSPTVAVDTFTRTESLNEVYFAMFQPDDRLNWAGNIKKLEFDIVNGEAVLVDVNGDPAIDPTTGKIKDSATTFWNGSGQTDGEDVTAGGVGDLLASRTPSSRVIYTNTGSAGAFETFNSSNVDAAAYGFGTDADLFNLFGVANQTELTQLINWSRGEDTFDADSDGSVTDPRSWILGDILHSRPVLVNYGVTDPNEFSQTNPDIRILVGTNAGFLHMFSSATGEEDWAFFPKELSPLLKLRQANPVTAQHFYGVDAPATIYQLDVNRDGTIDTSDGDKVYAVFGLRRGGRILYALDISDPDSPAFLWSTDHLTSGFSELGQTWSTPVLSYIPGYVDAQGYPKPTFIFGGGYDPNKDGYGIATPDSQGRGIYIVDAATGALIWSLTPAANSANNMQAAGLLHSVAAPVNALDSNGDGITDRIYFVDTGGSIWRVDLPGSSLPGIAQTTWYASQLANMNGGTVSTDRRFFNTPDVVRTKGLITRCTKFAGTTCAVEGGVEQTVTEMVSFDSLVIGSGDRTNPNGFDVDNRIYMIRDLQTSPYTTPYPTSSECAALLSDDIPYNNDFRCFQTITDAGLTNVTGSYSDAALRASNGWYLDLLANGEKSLSRSLTIDGKIYITSFSPDAALINVCTPQPGTGRLYVIDLFDASAVTDLNGNGFIETDDRSAILGSLIPDTPAPHFGSDGQIRLMFPSGGGMLDGNPFDTGSELAAPYGRYWYEEEY